MGLLAQFTYSTTVFLIRLYRISEFYFFKIFSSTVQNQILNIFEENGISCVGNGVPADRQLIPKKKEIQGTKTLEVEVKDPSFFLRMANTFLLGISESYMDNHWECDDIVEMSTRFFRNKAYLKYYNPWNRFLTYLQIGGFFNLQTQEKSWTVAKEHFDLGNDLYESFLDPYMQYTCGYWANASNLNEAQINKLELIAQKLKLKPGMKVLDLGCGWGGLCKYLAEKHGVQCVGVNISVEGVKWGKEKCKGLPVEFRLCDYRDINEKFDRVVSVGLMEHIGPHNYRIFFEVVNRCLVDDGIYLNHTIGVSDKDMICAELFYSNAIFPNGYLPYYRDVTKAIEGIFVIEDWQNFGSDYDKTLVAWQENFQKNWPQISHKYGERFYKMWSFYLQFSAGGFRARQVHLWQIVLTKNGLEGGYRSVR